MKLYQHIAALLKAIENCENLGNTEWKDKHTENLELLLADLLPSGSGFDTRTILLWNESHEGKLVFETEFHHMNDTGYYTCWTKHKVIITPSLSNDFSLRVTGRDKNQIKDYIAETFEFSLSQDV
jgi:hypothetical protein